MIGSATFSGALVPESDLDTNKRREKGRKGGRKRWVRAKNKEIKWKFVVPHGDTLTSIRDRVLKSEFRRSQTLNCSADSSSVHEGEHLLETSVGFANQITNRVIEVHHGSG